MICTDLDVKNFERNIVNYSSFSVNLTFTIFTSIFLFSTSFKSFFKGEQSKVIKWDPAITVLLIFNGLAGIFAVLFSTLTFCQVSIEFFDVILSSLNAVVFLPTFYVVCAFKCRSTRRFVGNVVILSLYCLTSASFHFYKLSETSNVGNVSSGIVLIGAVCNTFLGLVFVYNFGDHACSSMTSTHQEKNLHDIIDDDTDGDLGYSYSDQALLSKLTFSWMFPLLKLGYSSPLEMEDLQTAPPTESSKKHFQNLMKFIEVNPNAIFLPCIRQNWKLIFVAGLSRLFSDISSLSGAVCIKFIVQSLSEDSSSLNQTSKMADAFNERTSEMSWNDFASNSHVISVAILLLGVFQAVLSQTSSHLLTVAGTRSMSALQVLVYKKSLRLAVGRRIAKTASQTNSKVSTLKNETRSQNNYNESTTQCEMTAQNITNESTSTTDAASKNVKNVENEDDDDSPANEGNLDITYILSLSNEDSANIREFILNVHYIWALPLKVLAIIFLVQDKMGVSGMAGGLFGILLVIPLQLLTGKLMSKNNEKILACHDLRLSKSTEMIQGMKTVKLSCIESKILAGINTARSEELNYLKIDSYCWSGMTFLASVSTILMASIMIGIHTGLENESIFTSGDIFTTLALFNQLAVCLSIFPVTLPVLVKGLSSRRRLLEFLSRQEVTRYKSLTGKSQTSAENSNGRKDEAFSVQNAAFSWPTAIGVLDDINLEIETGSLTVISGSGGSGKSALMLALIEEMKLTSGKLNWNLDPRIALVSQKPWLISSSIRDNILMGQPFKEKRYRKVLSACDLDVDISLLPAGDLTEVGDNGMLLSGGQRQRLAIARALYSKAPCTFLDSPFSALDPDITNHIFQVGILQILMKRKRTVLLSTDRMDFMEKADKIIFIKEGKIKAQGPYAVVREQRPDLFEGHFSHPDCLVESRTAQERWKLLKNVARWGITVKLDKKENVFQTENVHSWNRNRSTRRNVRRMESGLGHQDSTRHRRGRSSRKNSLARTALLRSAENASHLENLDSSKSLLADQHSILTQEQKTNPNSKKDLLAAAKKSAERSHPELKKALLADKYSVWPQGCNNSEIRKAMLSEKHSLSCSLDPRHPTKPLLAERYSILNSDYPANPEMKKALLAEKYSIISMDQQLRTRGGVDSFALRRMMSTESASGRGPVFGYSFVHKLVERMGSNTSAISDVSGISGFSDDSFEDVDDDDASMRKSQDWTILEPRQYGLIHSSVYMAYLKFGGLIQVLLFVIVSVAFEGSKVYMDFLLRDWSQVSGNGNSTAGYLTWYFVLSGSVLLFSCTANLLSQSVCAKARQKLHQKMLTHVMQCPVDFFEAFPIGRIINRLSCDVMIVDQKLPSSFQRLTLVLFICLSALTVNVILSPWCSIFILPMLIFYWWLQHFYRRTSLELQRLHSASRVPVISHFCDTLGGLVTIRAFGIQSRFVNELCEAIDQNAAAYLLVASSARWLGLALDLFGTIFVYVCLVISLTTTSSQAGSIGLSVNYSLFVPIYLAWVVKFFADLENQMGAVERILDYFSLEKEEQNFANFKTKKECFREEINFSSVAISHLHDPRAVIFVNLSIPCQQKVGICGRSGSGKSTLLMSLVKTTKITSGTLCFGHENISSISLETLRKNVMALPQDGYLFSGSVRDNIDPHFKFDDLQVWNCLESLEISDWIRTLDGGLKATVSENGDNFSRGHKQLINLARVVLYKPDVVLLDEATNSLDAVDEVACHSRILRELRHSTVVTVTHRLANIAHYDRVLVVGNGKIVEDGNPQELLKKSIGFFASLWKASGEGYNPAV